MINILEEDITKNWKDKTIVASIVCITYNHEDYICETLDSLLSQQTTFSFEIIIGEDCSTDSTLKIITEYQTKYKNIITIVKSEDNVGMMNNFIRTIKSSKGEYLALCEGDDYWTNNQKLQKQVDFMNSHKEYTMCFHNSEIFNNDTQKTIEYFPDINNERDFSIIDFIDVNYASTPSVLYRKHNIKFPENFNTFKLGDWPLHMIFADKGKVKYFPDIMAKYRVHTQGVWSAESEIKKNRYTMIMMEEMNKYFEYKYNTIYEVAILRYITQEIYFYLDLNKVKEAYNIYKNSSKIYNINLKLRVRILRKISKRLIYTYWLKLINK